MTTPSTRPGPLDESPPARPSANGHRSSATAPTNSQEVDDRPAGSREADGQSAEQRNAEVDRRAWTVEQAEEQSAQPASLSKRFLRPQTLISFAIALAIAVFFVRRLNINPRDVWQDVRQTNPLIYGVAFLVFYGQFLIRAERWKWMLHRVGIDAAHGFHVPNLPRMLEIYVISWFANCIVPAKLGDAVRSYLFKQDTRAPFSSTLGTILSERLIDLIALFVAMLISAVVVFGTHLPGQANNAIIGGTVLLVVGGIVLAVLWAVRDHIEGLLPERLREQYVRLHGAIFATLRRPERFLGASFVLWLMEGLRVFLVCKALGAHVSFSTAIFVALVASLLTAIPITPAGLGVVEGAMTALLVAVGIDHSLALAITLLDRVIGYWSVILIGAIVYVARLRREVVATVVDVPAA